MKISQRMKPQKVIRSQMVPTMMYPAVSINTTSKSVRQLLPASVGQAAQEKTFAAQKTPLAASNEELIQSRYPPEIRWGRIHRYGAELEGVAARQSHLLFFWPKSYDLWFSSEWGF